MASRHTLRRGAAAAVLAVLVALAWRDARGAGFFWDDVPLIVNNTKLDSFVWKDLLFRDLWYGAMTPAEGPSAYWRPLMVASLHVDRALFGAGAAGPHLHNLAWHLAAVLALYGLALPRIGAGRAAAAALIFGIHPIQSEAVLWVAARNDLMSAALLFACLAAADRDRPALAALAALLAASAKEVGFLAPIYAALWGFAWKRPRWRGAIGAASGAAVAFAVRAFADLGRPDVPAADWLTAASAPGKVVATTLAWIVWPWPLTSTASLYLPPPSLFRWGCALVASAGAFWLWRAAPRRNGTLLAAALLAWAPTVFSVLASFYIGERFLYLPLAFLAVALAATVPARLPVLAGGVASTIAAFAALTVRVPEWRSELDVWRAGVARAPDGSSWAHLANALEAQGQVKEAWRAWLAATDFDPLLHAACEPPVRLLVLAGVPSAAADVSDKLVARGCTTGDFAGWRAVALLQTRRVDDARIELKDGPLRRDDVPLVATVCELDGDEDCVAGWALAYADGPSALRDAVFDLVTAAPSAQAPRE